MGRLRCPAGSCLLVPRSAKEGGSSLCCNRRFRSGRGSRGGGHAFHACRRGALTRWSCSSARRRLWKPPTPGGCATFTCLQLFPHFVCVVSARSMRCRFYNTFWLYLWDPGHAALLTTCYPAARRGFGAENRHSEAMPAANSMTQGSFNHCGNAVRMPVHFVDHRHVLGCASRSELPSAPGKLDGCSTPTNWLGMALVQSHSWAQAGMI